MRKIYCGTSGTDIVPATHKLSDIPVKAELVSAFSTYYGSDISLRPAQDTALFEHGLLQNNDNTIIATPTNSGKSLLSYLMLFKDAMSGKNVVLVEPLRALAYEKSEELIRIAEFLKQQSKIKIGITITTGDYRLYDEFINTRPEIINAKKLAGQIIVATPERLDAISRDKSNTDWFNSISLVCIDEAHLIGDSNRGAALELLIAFLRSLKAKPRIALMSATISNADELADWLAPCSVISKVPRYPTLEKWVYCLDDGEDVNEKIIQEIQDVLDTPSNSVLVFVYQTAAAENLAQLIAERLSGRRIQKHNLSETMAAGVAWFHAKLSTATKESVITAMTASQIRVTVSTTALSMGINLPATHVFIRDITFSGYKDLDVSDLMQMLGRAGRGSTKGTGSVFISKSNLSKERTIVDGITNETLPRIESCLVPPIDESYYRAPSEDLFYIDRVGNQIMGIINRFGNITLTGFQEYLRNTLGGTQFTNLHEVLGYLNRWKLVFFNEDTNEYELTHLGKVASKCYLPPLAAANAGQLIRDILLDNPTGAHIAQFAQIDYVIILCIISTETRSVFRYSKAMERKVNEYMEALPLQEKSYFYRMWIASSPESLFGSARMDLPQSDPRKQIYQATFTAMLIYDLSRGYSLQQLSNYYQVDVEEIQEKLRDNSLWLLYGLEKMLEVRSFYYHLKSNCNADFEQVRMVEFAFKKATNSIFKVVANLKFRSRLGELVRSIKRVYPNVKSYPGEGTISKLELAGISSVKDLIGKTANDLVKIGINRVYADLIVSYIRKRLS